MAPGKHELEEAFVSTHEDSSFLESVNVREKFPAKCRFMCAAKVSGEEWLGILSN